MRDRPASARLTTNTSHLMTRVKTTLLSTFGTRRARYRPSFRLESRISIRADRFDCTSQAGCKASMLSRLTDEDLRKRCVFVVLDKDGEVCRAERGLGSGISHTLGRLEALISGRTTSRMRLCSVSWDLRCLSKSADYFLEAS